MLSRAQYADALAARILLEADIDEPIDAELVACAHGVQTWGDPEDSIHRAYTWRQGQILFDETAPLPSRQRSIAEDFARWYLLNHGGVLPDEDPLLTEMLAAAILLPAETFSRETFADYNPHRLGIVFAHVDLPLIGLRLSMRRDATASVYADDGTLVSRYVPSHLADVCAEPQPLESQLAYDALATGQCVRVSARCYGMPIRQHRPRTKSGPRVIRPVDVHQDETIEIDVRNPSGFYVARRRAIVLCEALPP